MGRDQQRPVAAAASAAAATTGMAEWPLYALADYANNGRLLDKCRSLLSLLADHEPQLQQRPASQPPTGNHEDGEPQVVVAATVAGSDGKQAHKTTTIPVSSCTATSGYLTLEEQQQQQAPNIRQIGREGRQDRPQQHRSGRPGSINGELNNNNSSSNNNNNNKQTTTTTRTQPPNLANKSQRQRRRQKQDARTKAWPLWWHLIERVNYGKLAGEAAATATAAAQTSSHGDTGGRHWRQVMDGAFDRLYRTSVMELCQEISREVSPFVVTPNNEPSGGHVMKEAVLSADHLFQSKRRPLSSDARTKGDSAAGTSQLLPARGNSLELPNSSEARLRRLSWRRLRRPRVGQPSQTGVVESPPKLVRGGTFVLDDQHRNGAGRQPEKPRPASRIDHLFNDQLRGPCHCRWSDEPRCRGRYGESLVHVLLVNHSDEHLMLLILILKLWPGLLFDSLQSDKFRGLNCLHLTIAHRNRSLLEYLLEVLQVWRQGEDHEDCQMAEQLIEQSVTGSLFRPPIGASGALGENWKHQSTSKRGRIFWCDQLDHWPSANGSSHLILLDRIKHLQSRSFDGSAEGDLAAGRSGGGGGDQRSRQIYFGQTPLAWSVAFESKDMFELLVAHGRVDAAESRDECGNNCLHQLIINSQQNWTRFLLKFSPRLAHQLNAMQLTPFLLACHLGRVELFNELLELSAVEFWTYSSVKCCAYPLASLDPILVARNSGSSSSSSSSTGKHRQEETKSAVSVILESERSSDEQKAALLSTGVIKKLLEEKWKIFARRLFYADLKLTLLQLLLMTFACFMRPARLNANYQLDDDNRIGSANSSLSSAEAISIDQLKRFLQSSKLNLTRNACELCILTISLTRVWSFVAEWFRYRNLSLQFTYNPLVANLALANLLVVLCLPIRLVQFVMRHLCTQQQKVVCARFNLTPATALHRLDQLEDFMLILAAPLLWSSLLFFVAAFYVTGPFVAMINYMLMRDAKQFSLIYLIFLCTFAQSIFFTNYKEDPQQRDWARHGPTGALRQSSNTLNQAHQQQGSSAAQIKDELLMLTDWLATIVAKYAQLWLELFKMTLGVYEFQPFRHSLLSRGLLMLFIQLIPILFNMLIAMMNNTYSLVISQSERAWSFQWARTLFALERRLSDEEKIFYLKQYAINLSVKSTDSSQSLAAVTKKTDETGPVEPLDANNLPPLAANTREEFVPGLMVIKRTGRTRAELRRRLIGLWQKSTRRVLAQLAKENDGSEM